jgi:hypothetical protein
VTTRLAALRFFYVKTLKKACNIQETPYPKKRHRLPTILSPEEVAQIRSSTVASYNYEGRCVSLKDSLLASQYGLDYIMDSMP